VFACFNVKAPRGSLLNSTFPRPVLLGHTDGANFLANVVTRALAQLDRKKAWASSGVSHMSYEIAFSQNRVWTDSLPVGAGATLNKPGASAAYVWRRMNCHYSIEDMETRFPIQFVNAGLRANSEGDGLQKGGRGVVRSIKILDAGELRWSFLSPPHKPEGALGGKSAAGPEMVLLKSSGEKIDLPNSGQMTLARGDVLTVLSPGGGGCGAKA
jgi:N-methylhydantoinase B/oxoprolinase/acetone carboxylase alpha subunit